MDGGVVIIFENLLQVEIVSRTAVTKLRETRPRELSTLYSIQQKISCLNENSLARIS